MTRPFEWPVSARYGQGNGFADDINMSPGPVVYAHLDIFLSARIHEIELYFETKEKM